MFWSAPKNSAAIFSCQSLLLGTSVPNDAAGSYGIKDTIYAQLSIATSQTMHLFTLIDSRSSPSMKCLY